MGKRSRNSRKSAEHSNGNPSNVSVRVNGNTKTRCDLRTDQDRVRAVESTDGAEGRGPGGRLGRGRLGRLDLEPTQKVSATHGE